VGGDAGEPRDVSIRARPTTATNLFDACGASNPLRSGERATQRRRRVPRLAADDAAEVALIGEAEIGGQPREGALAAGQALERGADAQRQMSTGVQDRGSRQP
jgi:hypothetical protein